MRFAALAFFFVPAWAGGADSTTTASIPDSVASFAPVDATVDSAALGFPALKCGDCGDACVRKNGRPGFCGPNHVCRATRPKCPGTVCPLPVCPAVMCPESEQTTSTDSKGCKGCPVCGPIKIGCTSDASCKPGEHCVRTGLFGKCVANLPCSDISMTASTTDASGAVIFPWHCIPPQICVNGRCITCPAIRCANPNCDGPTVTPTDSNGCPMCPICACTDDASCPPGQQCVAGKCKPRRCSIMPYAASETATAALSRTDSISFPPFSPCPTGQYCLDGICHVCPIIDCARPPPCAGTMVPTTLPNGCPGCPRCSTEGTCVDISCPDGQQCVAGQCQPRRCSIMPYTAADTATAALSRTDAASSILPFNPCPKGQICVNGICRPCPVLDCPRPTPCAGTWIPTTLPNGCPGCPKCSTGGTCVDISCPVNQQCVAGKCVDRTCSPFPMTPIADTTRMAAALYPANRCPSGQFCENGVCHMCPMVDCMPPPCPGPWVPSYMSNGCPGCPKCKDGCTSDAMCPTGQRCVLGKCRACPICDCAAGAVTVDQVDRVVSDGCPGCDCKLPCCPPVFYPGQPPCRDCGLRG